MTKKMLAVALMAGSVLVLAGCNNTPAEEVEEVLTGEELVVEPVEEVVVEEEVLTGEELTGEVVEPVVVEQPVEVIAE